MKFEWHRLCVNLRFKALEKLLSSPDVFFFVGEDAAGCALKDFSANKATAFYGPNGMKWVIEESDTEGVDDLRSEGLEERPAILIVVEP